MTISNVIGAYVFLVFISIILDLGQDKRTLKLHPWRPFVFMGIWTLIYNVALKIWVRFR